MSRRKVSTSIDIVDLLKEMKWEPGSGTVPAHLLAIQHIYDLRWQVRTLEQLLREWREEKP